MERNVPIKLRRSDISKVGHTVYQIEGRAIFICNLETANLEEIILRSILADMGFVIIESADYFPHGDMNEKPDIEFLTDMPWNEYDKLMKD